MNFYILVVLELKYDDFLHFWKLFQNSNKLKFSNPFCKIERICPPELGTFLALFTHVHIFHPNEWFLYFSCPWVKIWWFSSFLKTFPKIEQIEVFIHRGPWDLYGSIHTCAHFPSQWVNFYILVVLERKYDDFLPFWKHFEKSKILKFSPTAELGTFLAQFTQCTFSIQMSEFLYFRCPGVELWWFSSFSKTFRKIKKKKKKKKNIEFSPTADLGTLLAQFTHMDIFHPNEWIFIFYSTDRSKAVVPVLVLLLVALWFILRGDLLYVFPCVILFLCFSVLLVLRLLRLGKRELILVLFVRLFGLCLFGFVGFLFLLGSGKGCRLWLWQSLDFSLNFFLYFSLWVEWKYNDFLHFRKLFEKSKKMRFFPMADLRTFLTQVIHVHIFHPYVWIFIFYLSWRENMMIFSFLKTFWKIEKFEVYTHRGPGDLSGPIHTCTHFRIQISDFLYFSRPGVKIWWFSSFS